MERNAADIGKVKTGGQGPRRSTSGSSMVMTLARKEILANLVSYKFFVAILLAVLLISASFAVMYRDYKGRLADYELNRPKPNQAVAIVPPNPLSILAKGLDEPMSRSFSIGVIGFTVTSGQSAGNAIFSFFPAPDFLYVVRVVMSLVALLFGFDQISRERERGTLRLILTNPVSRSTVLAGKWLGNFLSLAAPFLLISMLGMTLISLDPSVRLYQAGLSRLALILGMSVLYIALFLSLGMFVSVLTKRSASSLVILLFVWAVLVFVLPNMGTLLARQIVQVPSARALSEKRDQTWTREIFLSYSDKGSIDERITRLNRELDQMEEEYRNKFARLVRTAKTVNRVSPAAGLVYAMTDTAGTGIDDEILLKKDLISYKNRIVELQMKQEAQIPAFAFRRRSVAAVMAGGGLIDLGWLAVTSILVFFGAFALLSRADVR